MSSVTRRVRRGLRYEMVPRPCVECGIAYRETRYGTCMECAMAMAIEPITYDPSDGSTKGVRG